MKLKSAQATKSFARKLVKDLKNNCVLALYGDLGSGKTTFVQGLAEGLGVKKRVLSPTFVFQRTYNLESQKYQKLHHIDLYRLSSIADAHTIGIEEVLSERDALIAIEWPEIIEEILPKETIRIRFKKIAEDEREITVETS